MPATARRHKVAISTNGYTSSITKTYTIGKAVTLMSVHATKTVHGIRVTGKAVKYGKVKISVRYHNKTKSRTVKANRSGSVRTWFSGAKKGTYKITVKFVASKKYFGAATVTRTVKR